MNYYLTLDEVRFILRPVESSSIDAEGSEHHLLRGSYAQFTQEERAAMIARDLRARGLVQNGTRGSVGAGLDLRRAGWPTLWADTDWGPSVAGTPPSLKSEIWTSPIVAAFSEPLDANRPRWCDDEFHRGENFGQWRALARWWLYAFRFMPADRQQAATAALRLGGTIETLDDLFVGDAWLIELENRMEYPFPRGARR